jgi:hypothetical protein
MNLLESMLTGESSINRVWVVEQSEFGGDRGGSSGADVEINLYVGDVSSLFIQIRGENSNGAALH